VGHESVIELLLESCADDEVRSAYRDNALNMAQHFGHKCVLCILERHSEEKERKKKADRATAAAGRLRSEKVCRLFSPPLFYLRGARRRPTRTQGL
jgi:hypothetical protein